MMSIRGQGFRPTTVDTFPLREQSHLDGVWFANGMKRDGFTCSPCDASELALAMLSGPSALPARFKPSRPLISYKTREEALDETVTSNFGGQVQHGLVLPPYAVAPYRAGMRALSAATYDKRGIQRFGIHPEVLHLYDNDKFFAAIEQSRDMD